MQQIDLLVTPCLKRILRRVIQSFHCLSLALIALVALTPAIPSTAQAAYDISQDQLTVKEIYSTTAFKGWYNETVFSPICSASGAIYFVVVGPDLYPYVGKIANGQTTIKRLSTNNSYKVYNDGHHEFSIGIDHNGYLHVTGDMHNFPFAENSNVPAAWSDAKQLYWVSASPNDITSFNFVGNSADKQMPGTGFSYGFFRSNRNGELFYVTRALAKGNYFDNGGRGLALYYYSPSTNKWIARGALPPVTDANNPVLVWEDSGQNGGSYQMYKADLLFDKNNRMHLAVSLNNNNPANISNYVIYAYSDDQGQSFSKADTATITSLPMRVDAGGAQAHIVAGDANANIGQASLSLDKLNRPAVNYMYGSAMLFNYWNGTKFAYQQPSPVTDRAKGFCDEKFGVITLFGTDEYLRRHTAYYNPQVKNLNIGMRLRYLDYNTIKNANGVFYGIHWNTTTGSFKILELKITNPTH